MSERNGPTDGKRYKRVRRSDELKRNRGRPCELTPELQERVVNLIKMGNYIDTAARAVGLSKTTLYNWFKRAHTGEEPFKGFLAAVEKATGEAETLNVGLILRAANKGAWQASAWWLERRFPKRFGRSERLEIAGDAEHPLRVERVDLSKLSLDELRLMKSLRDKAAIADEEIEE